MPNQTEALLQSHLQNAGVDVERGAARHGTFNAPVV